MLLLDGAVELTPGKGVVYARSSQPLKVRVKPKKRGECHYSIKYRMSNGDGNLKSIPTYTSILCVLQVLYIRLRIFMSWLPSYTVKLRPQSNRAGLNILSNGIAIFLK